jgi:copper chaperone NosL
MKTKLSLIAIALSIFMFTSCKVEPKEIDYGGDHCHLCDMTVVDKSHAAQYVTKKGKSFVFDSVECLVRKINQENNEENMAFILVADYENPGSLVNAKTATYLISEKIKSPMGANLSAFKSKETATRFQNENSGKLYTWQQIKEKLAK